jgi:hypothetical protein
MTMNPECERFLQWLDEASDLSPPQDLETHAAGCETCRRRRALENTMRGHLGAAAAIEPARRASLVAQIAPVRRRRAHWAVRWSWVPAAAAAAIVAAVLLWPARPHVPPVSVTQVFGDLLGPLADAAQTRPLPTPAASSPTNQEDPLGLNAVLTSIWGDLEDPLRIGLDAMEAPRAAAAVEPPAPTAKPAGQTKGESI